MTASKKNYRKKYFQGNQWFEAKVAVRTHDALLRLHKQFSVAHINDTDEELLEYIRQQTRLMGRT